MRLPASLHNAVAKRQREFLAGRDCAQKALRLAGCPGVAVLPIGLDRLPVWPTGWVGSISHCATMACAIVASKTRYRALGIDVECIMSEELSTELGEFVATEAELAHFAGLGRPLGVTLVFSAKEALFKALYPEVRRVLDFDAARVRGVGTDEIVLQLAVDWNRSWHAGRLISVRFAVSGTAVHTVVYFRDGVGKI
ncbi:4'-phosphopantetheinyl transferase family protein [Cupriavidus basilensis]